MTYWILSPCTELSIEHSDKNTSLFSSRRTKYRTSDKIHLCLAQELNIEQVTKIYLRLAQGELNIEQMTKIHLCLAQGELNIEQVTKIHLYLAQGELNIEQVTKIHLRLAQEN